MDLQGIPQLVGLLGWPLEHTASPAMHNAAFRALGLEWLYVPLPVPPEGVPAALAGLHALVNVRGLNVTVPHKLRVVPHLVGLSEGARIVGAVNTLLRRREGWWGENTDGPGLRRALEGLGVDLAGAVVGILGAGGAARAAAWAARDLGAVRVRLAARRLEQARRAAAELTELLGIPVEGIPLARAGEGLQGCRLILNATPVGMAPAVEASPWPADQPFPEGALFGDLIYAPRRTQLLRDAAAAGRSVLPDLGVRMLLEQGAAAFELWTGRPAPRETMARTLGLAP